MSANSGGAVDIQKYASVGLEEATASILDHYWLRLMEI